MSNRSDTWIANILPVARTDIAKEHSNGRQAYFLPGRKNLDLGGFAAGLHANSDDFAPVQRAVKSAYAADNLDRIVSIDSVCANEIVRETAVSVANQVLKTFPDINWDWIYEWVFAMLVERWKKRKGRLSGEDEGERERLIREGKELAVEESPALPSTPGGPGSPSKPEHVLPPITSDDLVLVPPSMVSENTPTASIRPSIYPTTLGQTNFTLEVFTNDLRLLLPKEEIASVRCIRAGNDSNQATNYSLTLFVQEFEEALSEGHDNRMLNLRHGTICYRDSNGKLKNIQGQREFEVAINHLFNARTGDSLSFCFYEETAVEMRRLAVERFKEKRGAPRSPQFARQSNTKARAPKIQAASPARASKRNSIIGRGIQSFLPKKEPVEQPNETDALTFSPQPAVPHRLAPAESSNAVASTLRRILRVKPRPASQPPKVDLFEAHRKRFEGLFKVTEIRRFKRGVTDDVKGEVKTSERIDEDTEVGEVDEEEEEEEPEPLDFMVTSLQRALTGFDLTHLQSHSQGSEQYEKWYECCKLFQIDQTNTSLEDTVNLFSLNTPLYQYQAFAIYWQMRKGRLVGGGFVADDPGLGKTLTYLAYLVAERQLSLLWDEVTDSRGKNDGRHLQVKQHRENDECPSRDQFRGWIACPCRSSSPTSKWQPKPGVRLAVVPDNLVNSWKDAFLKYVQTDNPLDMKLVIANPASNPLNNGCYALMDSRQGGNATRLKSTRNPIGKSLKYDDDTPQANQDRCFVITTAQYYKTWAKKFEYKATYKTYNKAGDEAWVEGKNPGIVFGIAMIDECHEEGHWQKGKGRSGVLADLPKLNQPFLWGYSGTPYSDSPRTLQGILWALESHYPKKDMQSKKTGWEEHDDLHQFSHKSFESFCTEFQALTKPLERPDAKYHERSEQFFRAFKVLLQMFMLRRTAETSWFDRPLLALKPHLHSDIYLDRESDYSYAMHVADLQKVITSELEEKLEDVQKRWLENSEEYRATHPMPDRLSFNTQCRVKWRLRIIATFPYLIKLAANEHKDHLDLTTAEFVKLIGAKEKQSSYYMHLKRIVESSPKAMWLHKFICDLMQTMDVDGNEQKLVIVTNFNPVALVLKLFIEKYVKGAAGRVGAIYAGIKQRERTAIVDAFTDAVDEKGVRKQRQNFQFLVGTTRFISTGLQLTRACNIVLMEPDFQFSHEAQTYARIHRIGQRNPKTLSYRLINQLDRVERDILVRQTRRNEYFGRVYNLQDEFQDVGEDLDDEDPVIPQNVIDEKDIPKRQLHTSRKSRSGSRSASRGRPSQPQRTATTRGENRPKRQGKPSIPKNPVATAQLPAQTEASESPENRGRSKRKYTLVLGGNRPPIPTRTSSLSATTIPRPVTRTQAGPSRSQSQRARGSTSRGASASRDRVVRKPLPNRSVPVTQAGPSRGVSRTASRGRSGSRGGIARKPVSERRLPDDQVFSSPGHPSEGISGTPASKLPVPSTSTQSGSPTGSYTSRRTTEIITGIGTVIARQPLITDRSLRPLPKSHQAPKAVSPSDAGTYGGSLPSESSPNGASILGLARASSEALHGDETLRISQHVSYIEHEIAAVAREQATSGAVPDSYPESPPALGLPATSRARVNQSSDGLEDEQIDNILLASFPDPPSNTPSGSSSQAQNSNQEQAPAPSPTITLNRSANLPPNAKGNGIFTVYAEIREPGEGGEWPLPKDAPRSFPSLTSASSSGGAGSNSTPRLRRVGNWERGEGSTNASGYGSGDRGEGRGE